MTTLTHNISKYTSAKEQRLEARVSAAQKKLFQHAADLLGRSLTDFIINALQEASIAAIKEHEILVLNSQESKAFVQALLSPPVPNKKLLRAMKKHDKDVKSDV